MEAVLTCISSCSSTQGILVESQLLKLSYIYIDIWMLLHSYVEENTLASPRSHWKSLEFYKHL